MANNHTLLPGNATKAGTHPVPVRAGAKPFLKWAGGKGQLLARFRELFPEALKNKSIKNYYEPFLGSGAVFFEVAQHFGVQAAYLYDINEELVLAYTVIQKNVLPLIDCLQQHQKNYLRLDKAKRRAYFYQQRAAYNQQRSQMDYNRYTQSWIPRAAQMIFLNKTCFNGLFRVNAKGAFNTPAGEYSNPAICDAENLLAVAKVLEPAVIKRADFRQVKNDLGDSAFVYFDPPYRPISKTASFKAYSKNDFGDAEQKALAALFGELDKKGAYLMLSNSDPQNTNPSDSFFDDLYQGFNIVRVPAKRVINSNASKRGAINEIVVTNY